VKHSLCSWAFLAPFSLRILIRRIGYNKVVGKVEMKSAFNSTGFFPNSTEFSAPISLASEGYEAPQALHGAVNVSQAADAGLFLEAQLFSESYDPSLCARFCDRVNEQKRLATMQECSDRPDARLCTFEGTISLHSFAPIRLTVPKHAITSTLIRSSASRATWTASTVPFSASPCRSLLSMMRMVMMPLVMTRLATRTLL
jgi:hypothetical protein